MALASGSLDQLCCSRLTREKNDSRSWAHAPNSSCKFYSAHTRHDDVSNKYVWTKLVNVLESASTVIDSSDLKSFVAEDLRKRVRNQMLVIHNQEGRLALRN